MSKAFQRSGKKAYLFLNCENIELEQCEDQYTFKWGPHCGEYSMYTNETQKTGQ
jgi:hypothetical protein